MPIWLHVFVVLCLLTSNAVTIVICARKLRELRNALEARSALLDDGEGDEMQRILSMTSFE